jgi:hypothetical protein
VKIENERVRVYKDRPDEKTHQHSHPELCWWRHPVQAQDHPAGRQGHDPRIQGRGDVFSDAQTHIGENIGANDRKKLIVRLARALAPRIMSCS